LFPVSLTAVGTEMKSKAGRCSAEAEIAMKDIRNPTRDDMIRDIRSPRRGSRTILKPSTGAEVQPAIADESVALGFQVIERPD
jgi:hypothetical protein